MTQPTRSQIDAMTRAQAKTWAANADPRPQNCGQNYCSCIECPYRTTRVQDATNTHPSPLVGADGETTQGPT